MPVTYFEYMRRFIHDVMIENYDERTVTPDIYKKEILKFIKNNMDGLTSLRQIKNFLNESANDMIQFNLAKNKELYPIDYLNGLMKKNIPSKEVMKAISSKITAEEFTTYCQEFSNDYSDKNKNNIIEQKMNQFKLVEACKPTGNAFTNFFKRLFNIGGYNQKIAAYNECKESLRNYIGPKLTDEQFEEYIHSDKQFSSLELDKQTKKHTLIEIQDEDLGLNKDTKVKETKQVLIEKEIEEPEMEIKH